MPRLYLVRHGETLANASGRIQGWAPAPLSPRGRAQAERLADRLARLGIRSLLSSDLDRALETAREVARRTGLPVEPSPEWREMLHGAWQGRTWTEVLAERPGWLERHLRDPEAYPPEGGETFSQVAERVRRGLRRALVRRPPVAVVTHGRTLQVALVVLLGLPLHAYGAFRPANASITWLEVEGEGGEVRLLRFNDTSHLAGLTGPESLAF